MANNVTDWGKDQWLKILFGLASVPSTYYIALTIETPDEGFDGTTLAAIEPGDTYARQSMPTDTSHWSTPDGGIITNVVDINFPTPTADWGTVTHYAFCTAATAGNVYSYGEFLPEVPIYAGDIVVAQAGSLLISVTAPDTNTIPI